MNEIISEISGSDDEFKSFVENSNIKDLTHHTVENETCENTGIESKHTYNDTNDVETVKITYLPEHRPAPFIIGLLGIITIPGAYLFSILTVVLFFISRNTVFYGLGAAVFCIAYNIIADSVFSWFMIAELKYENNILIYSKVSMADKTSSGEYNYEFVHVDKILKRFNKVIVKGDFILHRKNKKDTNVYKLVIYECTSDMLNLIKKINNL